jgi:hypothetical protein
MPIDYDIYPELNLIVYAATGSVTPVGFFQVGDDVARDPRMKPKMNIILDFFSAEVETNVADLQLAIRKYHEARQLGHEVGRTAILTKSGAMKLLGEALKNLSLDTVTNFGVFHTEQDVIRWLALPERDTLQRWSELRARNRGTTRIVAGHATGQ